MPIIAEDNIILKIFADTKKAEKNINDLDDDVDKLDESTNKANDSFKKLTKIAGAAVIAAGIVKATRAMAGLVKKATEAYGEFEKTATSFEILVGNIDDAKKLIEDLVKFSAKTPFSSKEVQTAAKTLLGFGRTVKETKQDINDLGEIAAGSGAELTQLALIYGQVASLGKLQGQDALQFINAGIPVYDLLSKSLGKSVAELKVLQSQGKITFNDLESAIKDATKEGGKFFGALEKQSQTLQGIISTFQSNVDILLENIGRKFAPAFKSFYRLMNEVFVQLGQGAENIDNTFVTNIAAGLDGATAALESFSDYVHSWLNLNRSQIRLFGSWWRKEWEGVKNIFTLGGNQEAADAAMREFRNNQARLAASQLNQSEKGGSMSKIFLDAYNEALEEYNKELAASGKTGNPVVDGADITGGGVGGSGKKARIDKGIEAIVKASLKAYAKMYGRALADPGMFMDRTEGQFKEARLMSVFLSKDVAKYTAEELRNFQKYVSEELGGDSVLGLILEGYLKDAEGKEINQDLVSRIGGQLMESINDWNARNQQSGKRGGWLQTVMGMGDEEMAQFNHASNILLQSARNLTQDLLSEEIRRTDLLVQASRDRLQQLQVVAGEGNAEQLQLEEERQRTLLAQREDYIQRQRQLNALEITANNAVIVSNLLVGISDTFAKSTVLGIFTAAAAAATIASTIASIKATLSGSIPAYFLGTENVQGDGGIDNVPAFLSKGERVVDRDTNSVLNSWGVKNRDLLPLVGSALGKYQPAEVGRSEVVSRKEFKKLQQGLSEVKQAIYGIQFNVNIDPDGIGVAAGNYLANQQKIKNLMS